MFERIRVKGIQGERIQNFFRLESHWVGKSEYKVTDLLFEKKMSKVFNCEDGKQVIKLFKPRSWHEEVKVLWNKSRVHVEYQGSRMLRQAGIQVPEVYEVGIRYPWSTFSDFIGYCIMENLYTKQAIPIKKIIRSGDYDLSLIEKITDLLCKNLYKMKSGQVIYSDLHFNNIFIDKNRNNLIFIDTGAKIISNTEKFNKEFKKVIEKFCAKSAKELLKKKHRKRLLDLC